MAHRTVYAAETGRYGTRMLTAGDPLTLSGPNARAMVALGRATDKKPKRVKVEQAEAPAEETATETAPVEVVAEPVKAEAKPAKRRGKAKR